MNFENSITKRTSETPARVRARNYAAPPVDIYENKDELLLVADVPGVSRQNVSLSFEKDQLTIEAHRSDESEQSVLSREYSAAVDYRRTFVVPRGIDTDKISAEIDAGVLKVHLPKHASLKPRQIEIKSG